MGVNYEKKATSKDLSNPQIFQIVALARHMIHSPHKLENITAFVAWQVFHNCAAMTIDE